MKKHLFALLALVLLLVGCPSGPVDVGPDAGHRLGSFTPSNTYPGTGARSTRGVAATAGGADAFAYGSSAAAGGANAIAMGGGVAGPALASGTSTIALGENAQSTSGFSVAIGQSTLASNGGSVAIGEVVTASGANGVALGYSSTASGTFSRALGVTCNATGDNSTAYGVNATASRPGSFARNGGNATTQVLSTTLRADLAAASGTLLDSSGGAFMLANNTAYSLRVTIFGAQMAGTAVAADTYQLTVRAVSGVLTIANSTALAPTGGLVAAGWSAAITAPSGLELRIAANPGAMTVHFAAHIEWIELYSLTDSGAVFDPATLALTGWWRQQGGSPWAGTASAGISGSEGATEATHPPTAGATLNALATASFDGVNKQITPAGTLDTYVNGSSGAGWALFRANTISGTGTQFSTTTLFTTTANYYAIELGSTTPSVQFSLWDSSAHTATRAFAGTATWALVTWRHNGTNVQVGVNEAPGSFGGTSSVLAGAVNATGLASAPVIGESPPGFFFDGLIAEIGISDVALTDANFVSIKSYINARYALSL